MALWVFLVPGLLILLTAIAAHCRNDAYWSAVRWAVLATVFWLLPYSAVLRFTVARSVPGWHDPFRLLGLVILGGMAAACIAMVVGLSFAADRHMTKPVNRKDDVA